MRKIGIWFLMAVMMGGFCAQAREMPVPLEGEWVERKCLYMGDVDKTAEEWMADEESCELTLGYMLQEIIDGYSGDAFYELVAKGVTHAYAEEDDGQTCLKAYLNRAVVEGNPTLIGVFQDVETGTVWRCLVYLHGHVVNLRYDAETDGEAWMTQMAEKDYVHDEYFVCEEKELLNAMFAVSDILFSETDSGQ